MIEFYIQSIKNKIQIYLTRMRLMIICRSYNQYKV